MITDEKDLFCSGGANAGGDLSLYLVGRYAGKQVALKTARSLLMDVDRKHQAPYSVVGLVKSHGNIEIASIQDWIEDHFNQQIRVGQLAQKAKMSRRTFERKFKHATGCSSLQYIQTVRVENAKRLLEADHYTFEEITYRVGYEDSSTFSRIFTLPTKLSPIGSRKKFSEHDNRTGCY